MKKLFFMMILSLSSFASAMEREYSTPFRTTVSADRSLVPLKYKEAVEKHIWSTPEEKDYILDQLAELIEENTAQAKQTNWQKIVKRTCIGTIAGATVSTTLCTLLFGIQWYLVKSSCA
jgi:hypothetical protein